MVDYAIGIDRRDQCCVYSILVLFLLFLQKLDSLLCLELLTLENTSLVWSTW